MTNASSDVRAAWESAIWQHATVLAITDRVFLYDVAKESEFDLANLYSDADGNEPRLNFFLCLVQRRSEPLICSQTRYTYTVRVEYYLQQTDDSSNTYNTLVDRLESVDDLVRSSLGTSWGDTITYYQGGQPLPVSEVTIDTRKCWKGGFTYTAFKTA